MADIDKVIRALERCSKGTCPSLFSEEYKNCEYTTGMYCRMNKVCADALEVIKEQAEKLAMIRMIYGTDAKVVGKIVRCKDCVKCETKMLEKGNRVGNPKEKAWFCYGSLHGQRVKPDWFCADGKPKEEAKTEPVKTVTPEFGGGGSLWWIQCSECGHVLHSLQTECPGCHNKINWEGWN